MNRLLLGTAILLSACVAQTPPQQDPIKLDLGTAEDYMDFLEYEDREPREILPFKAEPLFVSAVGKVRAQPDVAVLTARISATDINESKATEEMGAVINAVQSALSGLDVETGFTAINSRRNFDELCLNENSFAARRHSQIVQDYYFNRNLDRQGDTQTKRRPPKPRIPQRVCDAQSIEVFTNMTIRVVPPEAAGDVLRALSDAGTESARLYGYDFSDYDALYQDAAEKAVKLAQQKAEIVARVAGATLGEIESFSVSRPDRTGRFGPQPNVIRSASRFEGEEGSVIDRYLGDDSNWRSLPKSAPPPPTFVGGGFEDEDVIVVTGSRISRENLAMPSPINVIDIEDFAAESFAGVVKVVTSPESGEAQSPIADGQTNALSISLLSGPQTITAAARLGYSYATPLDGKIIVDPEAEDDY